MAPEASRSDGDRSARCGEHGDVDRGYGAYPELGSPVWSMVDPTGSALTTATDREAPGAGFLPRIKRRLPAGVGSEIAAA